MMGHHCHVVPVRGEDLQMTTSSGGKGYMLAKWTCFDNTALLLESVWTT